VSDVEGSDRGDAAPDETATRTEAFVGRLSEAGLGAFDLLTVYLGDRLGLYEALTRTGAARSGELADAAHIDERYAREWLEQQAATGFLDVDDATKEATERRYSLPAAHGEALIDLDSPFSMAPLARVLVSAAQTLPEVMRAFRTGGGVAWSAYGDDMIESQGDFNRPWLLGQLGSELLPSIPDLHDRLLADPPARVADVACGVGWAAISMARAYPRVRIDGFDPDERSIDIANRLAKEAGVDDRVRFQVRDGESIGGEGPYDLAIVVEAVHDLARPVEVLGAIRSALAPGGSVLVADERVGDAFTAPSDEVERFMYAASVLVCLPGGLAEPPSEATGTVMRPDTLRRYATRAGLERFEVLPLEPGFLRFYRLSP
jgi:2-polyprenyl-3-methyl-5-hydroxy-6-metoxy-1,4-benzoquinol methylase